MAGTSWINFVANTKARAEDVNSNFDWIEQDIVPHLAGSKTNGVYDIGALGYAWKDLYMTGTLYLGGTDTYIKESTANTVAIYAGDTLSTQFVTNGVILPNNNVYGFEGDSNTYISRPSADSIRITAGSVTSASFSPTGMTSPEVITDYGFIHDRGDPAAYDRTLVSWTLDGGWHDWTLSGIGNLDDGRISLRDSL